MLDSNGHLLQRVSSFSNQPVGHERDPAKLGRDSDSRGRAQESRRRGRGNAFNKSGSLLADLEGVVAHLELLFDCWVHLPLLHRGQLMQFLLILC